MKNVLGTYSLRRSTMEDIQQLTELAIACDQADFGTADFVIEIAEVWNTIPLNTNSWVVTNAANQIVGAAFIEEMNKGRIDTYVFVHPEWKGNGIGSLLVDCTEERAREYAQVFASKEIQYEFNNIIPSNNQDARNILEDRGYQYKRLYSNMKIDLAAAPDTPAIPEEFTVRRYDQEQDVHALYAAYCESFQDTRGYHEKPFEQWIKERTGENCDQTLWYVAYQGEDLVGFVLGKSLPATIWIHLIGVKRTARKKGLGFSLLQIIFAESFKRGVGSVSLSVDTESLTNANQLYEKAGMAPVFQLALYQKQL